MSVAEKVKQEIVQPKKNNNGLLVANPVYKPFRYPWCYDAWLTQQRIHWLPEEVPLGDDVRDWQKNLSPSEKNLLTQIFRFFTQADVEVSNCYIRHYMNVFKPTEVLMMMSSFASMETVHIAAYSHLLDTIGMPESEYSAFMKYKEMKDKYDYMQGFDVKSKHNIAMTMAVFSAFTEGLQLFASFAILLNFPRFNKMKGMGQIVTWSVRDETLHCNSMIRLFRDFVKEEPQIWNDKLKNALAGFQETFYDSFPIFIPNRNGYRRIQTRNFVPVNKSWSWNRRDVSLRIPAGSDSAKRIEHRVASADANPYLVLACILSGLHYGLTKKLSPTDQVSFDNTEGADKTADPEMPKNMESALNRFKESKILSIFIHFSIYTFNYKSIASS